jgi:5'-nucleotidase
MKRTIWACPPTLILALLASGCGKGEATTPSKLIILHTNDLHSYLMGHDPEADYTPLRVSDDSTVGGFARLAAQVANERAAAGSTPVMLVDSGDFMMGTPFEVLGLSKAAELVEMAWMGYDAIDLGNHEFDWTPRGLAGIIAAARSGGFAVPLLGSNLRYDPTSPDDDDLQLLEYIGAIQRKVIRTLPNGLRVGIFGLLGKNAALVTPQAAPLTFADQATTAQALANELRNVDKVDLVVCLSHSGTDDRGQGEDADLARAVGTGGNASIDIIISGHTHVALPSPVQVNNTWIVQTGAYGTNLGKIELEVGHQPNGQFSVSSYKLVPIDDSIAGDAVTQARVDGYITAVDRLLPPPFSYRRVMANTAFDLPRPMFAESNLGDLVADAYLSLVSAVESPPDIAVESSGNIRSDVRMGKTGQIWFSDLFRLLPLGIGPDARPGYPLVSFYVTGKELKSGLELTAAAADLQNNDYFLQISEGATLTYASAAPLFNRVRSITLPGGTVDLNDTTQCYKVVTTLYLGNLLGLVNRLTSGALSVTPKQADCMTAIRDMNTRIVKIPSPAGAQEMKAWLSLMQFVSGFGPGTSGTPQVPEAYRNPRGRIIRQ